MLVGHQEVIKALSLRLPPVSIITGPDSVGKRLIGINAAMVHKVARVDFIEVTRLTVGEAARIKDFLRVAPMHNYRFVLINLDYASKAAVDDLLKSLEAPPSYARYVIISSSRVPQKILTRGHRYFVGKLKPEELSQILEAKGMSTNTASRFSILGQVGPALAADADSFLVSIVINVLESVAENDYQLFIQAYKAVDDRAARLIVVAMEESAAQRWAHFDKMHLGIFAKKNIALNFLQIWGNVNTAKPQLAVKTTFETMMRN